VNIFKTSEDPDICARDLDSKRLIKMILETAQLLSTAMYKTGGTGPYRLTHANHPCSVWAAESDLNYRWLINYFVSLNKEYTLRYKRTHKSFSLLSIFTEYADRMPKGPLVMVPNCTIFKNIDDTLVAYQLYLDYKLGKDEARKIIKKSPKVFPESTDKYI